MNYLSVRNMSRHLSRPMNEPQIIIAMSQQKPADSNAGAEVIKIFQRINQELEITIAHGYYDSKVACMANEIIFKG